jgi:hypothetical protein
MFILICNIKELQMSLFVMEHVGKPKHGSILPPIYGLGDHIWTSALILQTNLLVSFIRAKNTS